MPNYLDKAGVIFLRDKIKEITNNKMTYQMRTMEEWNQDPMFMSKQGVLYIFTNCGYNGEGQPLTGLKIGDGTSYVIDLPFISGGTIPSQQIEEHLQNEIIHITMAERNSWNNKVTAYISNIQNETIVFSKE